MTEEMTPRRQPHRISDPIDLGGEYAGWWVRVRLNTPMGRVEDLDSRDLERIYGALCAIAHESNYVDDDGAPIDVTTSEGWRRAGTDLVGETIRVFKEAISRSPLVRTTSTSSSPGSPATDLESPSVIA